MYYPIDEGTARLAHDNMSMRDYIPNSATSEYRAAVDRAAAVLEEVKAKCKTQAQRERAEYYFDLYAKKLAQAINQENAIGTRCPSVLISGASNFAKRKSRLPPGKQTAPTSRKQTTICTCSKPRTFKASSQATRNRWNTCKQSLQGWNLPTLK